MAKLMTAVAGKRSLVLVLAVVAAVLGAKGISITPYGFFDGH
ncbi:MAG: hypothetical protein WCH31_00995 [Actinomycetes bacterium]